MSSGKPANPMSQIRAAEPVAINLSFFLIHHGNHPASPVQHPTTEADDSLLGHPQSALSMLRHRWRRVTLRATVSPMKIRHKGLRALHERDDRARLPPNLVPRLRRILFRLQEATHPRSADAPGFRLHPLKGDRAGQWSVRVSGNWRVVFRFEDGEAVDVDLIDYH